MNGAGNDFVVVEARSAPFDPTPAEAAAIADRKAGIGCDQLIAIAASGSADARMRIWNPDGGEVEACGNAARCVGWLLMQASGRDEATIETKGGLLQVARAGEKRVTVDMGEPKLDWKDIPLAEAFDTRRIELQVGPIDDPVLRQPGCVSMGNPHVVFFVPDAEAAPVRQMGPIIEHHPLFPQRVNVGFAQIKARDRIRLRVWERGAGLTRACGTGACAAVVAASRRGLADRKATVELDGGDLVIKWSARDNHVLMTGPIAVEFTGQLP
jgi:diaminopimelate epimerase